MSRLTTATLICLIDLMLLWEMALMYAPGRGPSNLERLVVWTGAAVATLFGLRWSVAEYRRAPRTGALLVVGGSVFLFLTLVASLLYLIWFMATGT